MVCWHIQRSGVPLNISTFGLLEPEEIASMAFSKWINLNFNTGQSWWQPPLAAKEGSLESVWHLTQSWNNSAVCSITCWAKTWDNNKRCRVQEPSVKLTIQVQPKEYSHRNGNSQYLKSTVASILLPWKKFGTSRTPSRAVQSGEKGYKRPNQEPMATVAELQRIYREKCHIL